MGLSALVGRGITDYSERVEGEMRNHEHTCRFDVTDGFIGITQFEGDGTQVTDRVLLSPRQFTALLAFLKRAKQHRRSVR
jgi:hypothetical protein